jgi:hypothetical protein
MKHNRFIDLILRLATIFFLLGAMLSVVPPHRAFAASRYYVKANGGNDLSSGLSWGQAFKTLQKALAVANAGDEIWVAKGIYRPNEGSGLLPNLWRYASFYLKDGVSIYGGFAGNETSLAQRDISNNFTILSGDVDGDDLSNSNGIVDTTSNIVGGNSYHVVRSDGNASTAVLDGFIINAGLANDNSDPHNKGGGVYAYQSSATLRNLSFIANSAGLGGGLACVECQSLSLTTVDFSNNFALFVGGGLHTLNSSLSLSNAMIGGNLAGTAGGGMDNSTSTVTINNVSFFNNQAPLGGGMANRHNTLGDMSDLTFNQNIATDKGGGVFNLGSNPVFSNVILVSNSAVSGGGMYNLNSSLNLLYTTFSNNTANFGGGLFNDNSNVQILFALFEGNSAQNTGGGMSNLSSIVNLAGSTLRNNQANVGGGMYNYTSNPGLDEVDFENNRATSTTSGGGGMFNYTSSPVLTRVNFNGNIASNAGGGMYNYSGSNPKLTDVSFSGNSAPNGAGMRNHLGNNQPELNRVTFVGNEAGFGGGMSNDNSTPKLTNVTFSGNSAQHQGGGMHNYQSSPELMNVTFYGNVAEDSGGGGGMYNISGSLPFLRNVILAGSFNGDCVNGPGGNVAGQYTLMQDTSVNACGAVNGSGFTVGVDPKLGPLANNGGFTLTHALLKDSPAIDAVLNNFCPADDQREVSRPQKTYCDIGAVEYNERLVFLPLVRK